MPRLGFAALVLLGGCAAAPTPIPVRGNPEGPQCSTTGIPSFVGRPGTTETGGAILKATHARILRWAPIGYMLTMDYRTDRVTVRLGPDRRVTNVSCG